jgi:flagellar basal body rod protein FlgG
MSSYGLWLSAAGMKVNEHRQTLLANNLANAETVGFKQDLAVVTQRRTKSQSSAGAFILAHPVLDGLSGGINVRPPYHDFAQGRIEHTGRPLDVAIQGEGFFVVGDGQSTRLTRDGRFSLNPAGELVLAAGEGRWKFLDSDNSPIQLETDGGPPEISPDGQIRQRGVPVATLALVEAKDRQTLRKTGVNLFEMTAGEMAPVSARLVPEAVEESNFDVMTGLAGMIEASRAYEINANLIRMQDEMTGQAISRVGRIA